MGNQEVRNCPLRATPEFIQKQNLPHIGSVSLMRWQGNICLRKTYSFSDNFLMEDRVRRLKTRAAKLANSSHIINIYSVSKQERAQLCANNYQVQVYLQKWDETLGQTIIRRLQQRNNFSQQELLEFIAKAVDSLIYMQDNGLKNIAIDSHALLFCQNTVKVLDSGIAHSEHYQTLLTAREQGRSIKEFPAYLPPELLEQLKQLNYDPYISPKADIFSLGMVLLQMITLQSMSGYYDYNQVSIDHDSLIHRISKITHSLSLKTIIAEMLEFDPQERIGLVSLRQKIGQLRTPHQMPRSKSSKMLKDLLSQSRRSRNSQHHNRLPSAEKKHKIDIHCSQSSKKSQSEEIIKAESAKKASQGQTFLLREGLQEPNIDQIQFKNLVRNKLVRPKLKENQKSNKDSLNKLKNINNMNKENLVQESARLTTNSKQDRLIVPVQMSQPKTLQERNFLQFQSSLNSHNYEESFGSKMRQKNSLGKLVEDSGLEKLLKIEHLQTQKGESSKNTSRFGFKDIVDYQTMHTKNSPPQIEFSSQARPIEIQSKEEDYNIVGEKTNNRCSHKIMTFNSKELLENRSCENSIQDKEGDRLTFSPIVAAQDRQGEEESIEQASPQLQVTIRDVPVVVSQEKAFISKEGPKHFGKLQRQLNLCEAKSIEQDSSWRMESSKVIETFNPRQHEQPQPSSDNSCFLKKRNKPQLNLDILNEDSNFFEPVQPAQIKTYPSATTPAVQQPFTRLDMYHTSQSIEPFSNFSNRIQQSNFSNRIQQYISPTAVNPFNKTTNQILNQLTLLGGEQYQGELSTSGLPQGNGIMIVPQNYRYSGSFRNGKFQGFGTLLNLNQKNISVNYHHIDFSDGNWIKFEGQFKEGKKQGFGTIYFGGGAKFSGCLKEDVIQGYGCFYGAGGELVSGLWSRNRLNSR